MNITGSVLAIFLGLDAKSLVTTPQEAVTVSLEGFVGDQHAGFTRPADSRTPRYPRGTPIGNLRQVSIVSQEELAEVADELSLPELRAEWLGANLLLRGIPHLTHLLPSTRLCFEGGVTLWVSDENRPCSGPGKIVQAQYPQTPDLASRFVKAAMHKRGLVAVVEMGGVIQPGDEVEVRLPDLLPFYLKD